MNLFKTIRQAIVNEKKERLEEKTENSLETLRECVNLVKKLEERASKSKSITEQIECETKIEKLKAGAFTELTRMFNYVEELEELE